MSYFTCLEAQNDDKYETFARFWEAESMAPPWKMVGTWGPLGTQVPNISTPKKIAR